MNINEFFVNELLKNKEYLEAEEIVKANTKTGKIFLVGSAVYKPLFKYFHKIKINKISDYDFITEVSHKEEFIAPKVYKITTTKFGDIRLKNESICIDIFPLNKAVIYSDRLNINNMTTKQKLRSYFERVPLNFQAVAYDITSKKLIGKEGINSIKNFSIKINNIEDLI